MFVPLVRMSRKLLAELDTMENDGQIYHFQLGAAQCTTAVN